METNSIADRLQEEINEVTYEFRNRTEVVFLDDVKRLLRLAYDLGANQLNN